MFFLLLNIMTEMHINFLKMLDNSNKGNNKITELRAILQRESKSGVSRRIMQVAIENSFNDISD